MVKGVACSSASSSRYWFDSATGMCISFKYLGCQGNANAFTTMELCQEACKAVEQEPKCDRGQPLQISPGRFWSCGPDAEQGSCPHDHECHFDGNRFGCCPSRVHICSSPVVEGTSCYPGPSLRWAFHRQSGFCQSFIFNGCDENSNNFVSQQECKEYCIEAECPYGGSPMTNTDGSRKECTTDESCKSKEHFCWPGSGSSYCCLSRKAVCSKPMELGQNCTMQIKRSVGNCGQQSLIKNNSYS